MLRLTFLTSLLMTTACSVSGKSEISDVLSAPLAFPPSSISLPDIETPLPSFDLSWSDAQETDLTVPVISGGGDDLPSVPLVEYSSLADEDAVDRQTFELEGSTSEVLRAVVVDFAGLGLVYDTALSGSLSFSGGPYTAEEALDALLVVVRGQNFTFDRVGSVVVVASVGSETTNAAFPATGIFRLQHSSPTSVAAALSASYPALTSSVIGRTLFIAGPSPLLRSAISQAVSLDTASSESSLLPWRALVVSPDLAAAIEELGAVLASSDDPLSLSFRPLGSRGLVFMTGHNAKALDEAALLVKQLDEGLSPRVSRVLALSEPDGIHAAVLDAFASDVSAKTLSASLVGSQLLLSGSPSSVSAASSFVAKFSPEPAFIEVRAVVAETRRGSAVDRSFTLGYVPGQPGGIGGLSSSPTASSVSAGGFTAALSYLDQDTNTRLLATPRIGVAAGSSSELVVGSQVPVLVNQGTDDGSTTQSVSYRDAGVKLVVSPVILADGRIRLDVSQELSDATQNAVSGIDSPTFSTRSMKTQVVVSPGETVAVAGLDYDAASLSSSGSTVGSTEARKLVILLSATPSDPSLRRSIVSDSLARLNTLLDVKG